MWSGFETNRKLGRRGRINEEIQGKNFFLFYASTRLRGRRQVSIRGLI